MSKFKVGDKVTDNGQGYPIFNGVKVGTVVRFWEYLSPEDSPVVEVEGHEWYYIDSELELVEEPVVKIEAGKYYKTAKGDKVGPAEVNKGAYQWNIPHGGGFYGYTADGVSCLVKAGFGKHHKEDNIVGEWLEEEPSMKCEAEKRGYKKVVITEDVRGWPVGTVAWADFNTHKVYNDDCSVYWYHIVGDSCEWLEEGTEAPKVEEKVFGEVYLGVGNFPYTYSTFCDGETKGTATVTYTDGKPTKMVWTSTE